MVEAKDNSGDALGYIVTVTDNEAYDGSSDDSWYKKMTELFLVFHFYLYLKHLDLECEANEDDFKNQFKNKKVDYFVYSKVELQQIMKLMQ